MRELKGNEISILIRETPYHDHDSIVVFCIEHRGERKNIITCFTDMVDFVNHKNYFKNMRAIAKEIRDMYNARMVNKK